MKNTKRYDSILKMAISRPKNGFLIITFINSHLMIDVNKIQLDKSFCPIKLI